MRTIQVFLRRMAELELLDRVYVLAAGSFASLLPVLLLITSILGGPRTRPESIMADQIIARLNLDGAAADAVRTLLPRGQLHFYAVGLAITLFGAFSLSRRAARAYSAIWGIPDLQRKEMWRGLVWVVLQLTAILSVAELRDLAGQTPSGVRLLLLSSASAVWFGAELIAQRAITRGRIGWGPLSLAAGLVALGRLLVAIWSLIYLSGSITKQAELYGPVGVVFALFTSLLVAMAATLFATLIAAVLTRPRPSPHAG